MSTIDPTNSPGGTAAVEVRLRHALAVVAASTPVSDPVPGSAPVRRPLPRPLPSDRRGERSRPLWRMVAAAAVVLTLIGGVAVLAGRRDQTRVELTPSNGDPGPGTSVAAVGPDYRTFDHWHEAYGFYVCDGFLADAQDVQEDPFGIHTHGDGIIHLHPYAADASGTNATLGLFGHQIGIALTDDGWTLRNGDTFRTGTATCDGRPADLVVYRWSVGDPAGADDGSPIAVYTDHFDDIVFDSDRQAYTIAVVPEGVVPPRPPSIPTLDQLTDVPDATSPFDPAVPSTVTVPPG